MPMSQDPSAPPAPPQPTTEHKKLAEHCGTWNVDCAFNIDPSQPPMKVKGKETVEMFGEFWTTSLFEAEMFGAPFKGKATLGYDPAMKKYVSTWIDTMNPNFYSFTGNFDKSGKVLEMSGEGYDCSSGRMTTFRTTENHKSKNERVFEMFMNMPDGEEVKLFTYVYRRA
jgi:hypothetical protein